MVRQRQTPAQTIGPFFHDELRWNDGSRVLFSLSGERITLTGRVFDGNGTPVADALLETWQADPAGRVPATGDAARPCGYGRVVTGDDGRYDIETVMPGRYTGAAGEMYAPQLNVPLFARGLLKAVRTRVFLAGMDAIMDDPLVRAIGNPERVKSIVAVRDPQDSNIYHWDVRLQGEGETVFIEF